MDLEENIDLDIDYIPIIKKERIVINKKVRRQRKEQKLSKLYNEAKHNYPQPVWKSRDGKYLKRYYKNSNGKSVYSFYKKISNRKVRRYKGKIKNGNNYRKLFDYQWTCD